MSIVKGRHINLIKGGHYKLLEDSPSSEWNWGLSFTSPKKQNPTSFPNNSIRTARYTIFSFLPKQLYFQFKKFANLYFLFISILQLVPGWSPTGRFTTIFPLTLFVTISMAREAYDDFIRHKHDRNENNSHTKRMKIVPAVTCTSSSTTNHTNHNINNTANICGVGAAAAFSNFNDTSSSSPTNNNSDNNHNDQHHYQSHTHSIRQPITTGLSFSSRRPSLQSEVVWETTAWHDLHVGDIILLNDRDPLPADVLILSSSNPNGICYIETANLDGETNLKLRQALHCTHSLINMNTQVLSDLRGNLSAEPPSGNLYSFEGVFELLNTNHKVPLSIDQLLLRGSTIRNTKQALGIVVYTGEETRIRRNANQSAKTKRPAMEKLTNRIVLWVFMIVVLLAVLNTIASTLWEAAQDSPKGRMWYLGNRIKNIAETFFSSIILYNALIPLSLYVTMEMVKLMQVWLMNHDLDMYDEERDIPAESFTSSLNEELGQVQYLFTDKTGTLTENIMEFQKFSVNGTSFSMEMENEPHHSFIETLPSSVKITGDLKPKSIPNLKEEHAVSLVKRFAQAFHSRKLDSSIHRSAAGLASTSISSSSNVFPRSKTSLPEDLQPIYDFLECLALCHTVVPEVCENNVDLRICDPNLPPVTQWQNIHYQASSPDEVALINAARELRFVLTHRDPQHVHLNILNSQTARSYEILHVIPFSSARKRMSVIYRTPENEIILVCKGADSIIMDLLISTDKMDDGQRQVLKTTMSHVDAYASEGLRTLMYAKRVLKPEEYEPWDIKYSQASTSLENRVKKMEEVGQEIEKNLLFVGATAIEDRLQDQVPETIEKLRRADIKVWMLTGDKKETAVNIGYTCRLIRDDSDVVVVTGSNLDEIAESIQDSLDRLKDRRSKEANGHLKRLHVVLVIEGGILSTIEKGRDIHADGTISAKHLSLGERSLLRQFLCLGMLSDCVICCRFSPSQKALMVSQVKKIATCMAENNLSVWNIANHWPKELKERGILQKIKWMFTYPTNESGVTLAIGDGANDIPMIQSASVGIGITGREGLAAARASDYAIAQFRFLQQLLLVHGRWNYVRLGRFTLGTFYKCVVFYCCQTFYQIWTGFSGTSIFEQWTLSLYNILFSSLPILVVGMFEKDLSKPTLLGVPELYRLGQHHRIFNFRRFIIYMTHGLWHMFCACFITFVCYQALFVRSDNMVTNPQTGISANSKINEIFLSDMSGPFQESSLYVLGTIVYTNVVFIITLKIGYIESRHWTWLTHAAAFASLGCWFLFQYCYSEYFWPALPEFGYDSNGLWYSFKNIQPAFWSIVLLSVALAVFVLDFVGHTFKWTMIGGGIQLPDKTWVNSKIGDLTCDSEESKQELASKVAEYLKSIDVPVEVITDSVEWWQAWEKDHF